MIPGVYTVHGGMGIPKVVITLQRAVSLGEPVLTKQCTHLRQESIYVRARARPCTALITARTQRKCNL